MVNNEKAINRRLGKVTSNLRTYFTLIELLVVVAIISILMAILLPALNKAKKQASSSFCASNLKQVGHAMMMYTNDFDGYIPTSGTDYENIFWPSTGPNVHWANYLSYHYLGMTKPDITNTKGAMLCPSDDSPNPYQGIAYSYGLNLHASENTPCLLRFRSPSSTYLAGDGKSYKWGMVNSSVEPEYRHRNGVNILFADGHTDWHKFSLPTISGHTPPWYGYTPLLYN